MSEPEPLEELVEFVTEASIQRGDSAERIQERVRFVELLHVHARAGWVDPMVLNRLVNLIVNPENWDAWKERGGDAGLFDDDSEDGHAEGNGEAM